MEVGVVERTLEAMGLHPDSLFDSMDRRLAKNVEMKAMAKAPATGNNGKRQRRQTWMTNSPSAQLSSNRSSMCV